MKIKILFNKKVLFNKTKYITVSVTPLNRFEINTIQTIEKHRDESNRKDNILVIECRTYAVRKNCIVKLTGCIESNTNDIMLSSCEKFFVKAYTGYDIYGVDHVVYREKEYILHWNSKVCKLLYECS